jgi:hypothetical protein
MKNKANKFELTNKQYDLEVLSILVLGPLLLGVINAISMVFFNYSLFN